MQRKKFTRKDHVYKNPTINADSFDKRRFSELLHMSKGLQKVKDEGKNQPYFEQLMGDMWGSFFKTSPKLLKKDEINKNLLVNRQVIERLLNDEIYQKAHELTKLDDLHSALNTIGFSEKVLQWIEETTDTNKKINDSFKNMEQQEKKHGEDSKQHCEAMEQYIQALEEQIKNANGNEFSEMLQQTVEETNNTEQNLKDLFGGIQAGKVDEDLKEVPLRDQFALAEYLKNNYKMKKIAKWTGRFKAIAQSKQKSISKESISRSGVTIGNDIDKILPSELINMTNPVTKNDFLRRFAEGETLQYATKGKQTLGKGSIILCLDQSGSMENLDSQSKGFTLALMSIAKKQKRDFALITFSKKSYVKQYPKGKINSQQLVEFCKWFMNGGTNFTNPLSESLKLIQKDRFKNADIVFITDGEDSLHPEFIDSFNKEKEKLGFSVVSLLLGKQIKEKTVSQFSDKIYHASDFQDENAHEVFKI